MREQRMGRTLWKKTPFMRVIGIVLSAVFLMSVFTGFSGVKKVHAMVGDGSSANPYQIASAADFQEFVNLVNNGATSACAILARDINITGVTGLPIEGSYSGVFNGDGNTISGLILNSTVSGQSNIGLFRHIAYGGVVKNLILCDGEINSSAEYVGSIAGDNDGTIMNCINYCNIISSRLASGGIAGNNYGNISYCINHGTVYSEQVASGISNGGTIDHCINFGAITSPRMALGITHGGTVSNSVNAGLLKGVAVGGIAFTGPIISDCYNVGKIESYYDDGLFDAVGGIVINCYGTVKNCYNLAEIIIDGLQIGGICGIINTGSVDHCYYNSESTYTLSAIGLTYGGTVDTETVKGLLPSQMTGSDALTNMVFSYANPSDNPWLTKASGYSEDEDIYYYYSPHIKGFNLTDTGEQKPAEQITPNDWPAKIAVAFEFSSGTVKYDGTAKEPLQSVKVNGTAIPAADYSVSYVNNINVGNASLTININGTSNSIVSGNSITFAIDRADAVVRADNKTKEKNADDPALSAVVSGTYGSDTLTYALSREPGEDVGTYTITPSGDAVQGNYNVTYETGTLTITEPSGSSVQTPSYIFEPSEPESERDPDLVANLDGTFTKTTVVERSDGATVTKKTITDKDGNVLETVTETVKTSKAGTKTVITVNQKSDGSRTEITEKTYVTGKTYSKSVITKDGKRSETVEAVHPDGETVRSAAITDENGVSTYERSVTDASGKTVTTKYTVTPSEDGFIVTFKGQTGKAKTAVIPKYIKFGGKRYKVNNIAKNAFNKYVRTITIPNTIKTVEQGAFDKVSKKAKVDILGSKNTFKRISTLLKESGINKKIEIRKSTK